MNGYNEIDPYAADWIENLSRANYINPGVVDRRSIVDLQPDDVRGFVQFHAFAGLGVWSRALRLAGIPDDFPIWTASCPCQPYSVAGAGGGVDDERHLWPDYFRLVEQCLPAVIIGEQVASKSALAWLDTVRTDLEGAGYAFGASDLASAGAGAPHIRQRLYFCAFRMADADSLGQLWRRASEAGARWRSVELGRHGDVGGMAHDDDGRQILGPPRVHDRGESGYDATGRGEVGGLVDSGSDGDREHTRELRRNEEEHEVGTPNGDHASVDSGPAGGMGHHHHQGSQGFAGNGDHSDQPRRVHSYEAGSIGATGATRGFWADADWLPCRDAKWRPVEPGSFPLAHGSPTRVGPDGTVETQPRVGKLRGYGNAVNAHLAAEFIRSAFEAFEICTQYPGQ